MRDKQKSDQLRNRRRQLKKQFKKSPSTSLAREIQRLNALIAYYKGLPSDTVAECYDMSERSLQNWIQSFERYGIEELKDEERSGRPPKLSESQQCELKELINHQNQRIWVARHVYGVISTIFGVVYSVQYLPELLRKLGLSFHKAVHNLVKKDAEKRRTWIQEKLPEIYRKQREEGWRIFYQDEVGFATEGTLGYTWGIEGKKTEIKNYGRHGRINLMGVFELGKGTFYGILTSFKVNAMRFRRFLCHLKRETRTDKILLICDNAKFHKAQWLIEWVIQQQSWLQLEFLPPYSPDFNPIERLWRWMKTEFIHNKCWKTSKDLKKYLANILDEMQAGIYDLTGLMKKENERVTTIAEYYQVSEFQLFNFADESPYAKKQIA